MINVQTEYGGFGFTIMSEDQITSDIRAATQQSEIQYLEMAHKLKDLILPLLHNLAKNPDSEYIKWPNRSKAINDFIFKMYEVIGGSPSEEELVQ
jgi:hypothetical protein